jgi:cytochrome oxidase Cu insertion factor (SCO1/SenC/PrrC family)
MSNVRTPVILCALAAACLVSGCGSSTSSSSSTAAAGATPAAGSAGPGTRLHLTVPAALERLPLTDQHGKTVRLNSWPSKTVLLVPFLSLCQDVCPLITGNLLAVLQALRADHAAANVEIVDCRSIRNATSLRGSPPTGS